MTSPQALGVAAEPPKRRAAPRDLGKAGRSVWRALSRAYEFAPHEEPILAELARTHDLLARLREELAAAPSMTVASNVHGRVQHPCIPAIAATQETLRKLHLALCFPDADDALGPPRPAGQRSRRSHRRAS